jgi:hypothetical protein
MDPKTLEMLHMFFYGFAGSFAAEIVLMAQILQSEPLVIPKRLRQPLYWLFRTVLAIVGGGLALAYDVHQALLAVNIGASTPLIIQAFSQGYKGTTLTDIEREPKKAIKSGVE